MTGNRMSASSGLRTRTASPRASTSICISSTRLAVLLVILLSLLEATCAQNIHFSNGWYPGKKRSAIPGAATLDSPPGAPPVDTDGFSQTCAVRPELGKIINKLVMEELFRLPSSCVYGASRKLRDMLESTATKLDKW